MLLHMHFSQEMPSAASTTDWHGRKCCLSWQKLPPPWNLSTFLNLTLQFPYKTDPARSAYKLNPHPKLKLTPMPIKGPIPQKSCLLLSLKLKEKHALEWKFFTFGLSLHRVIQQRG